MKCDLTRFWSKVDKQPGHGPWGDCWLWVAFVNPITGYGQFWDKGHNHLPHRWLFQQLHGLINGRFKQVMHSCDVRKCVRPSHLSLGTPRENTHDSMNRGRRATGVRHGMAKLTLTKARRIRKLHIAGETLVSLGKRFGVHHSQISHIVSGQQWKEAA